MKMFGKKINKRLTLDDIKYLSSHEISDIIGNYSKEDLCIGKKHYKSFDSLNYFTITIV